MSFARSLSIASELTSDISQEVRKLGILIDQGVVIGTPVDTGAARGSWLVGVGQAPAGVSDTTDKSGGPTIQRNNSIIAVYPAQGLPDLWIVNNQPYIGRLNDGSSLKAPAKFVETAIERAIANGR